MDKTASKPMPCPFCGEKPKVYNEVYCGCVNQKCDLGANAPAGGIPISIDVWNRRSPSEPQASVRGAAASGSEFAEIIALRSCLGFFSSVIKSGEDWSPVCDAMYADAQQALKHLSLAEREAHPAQPPAQVDADSAAKEIYTELTDFFGGDDALRHCFTEPEVSSIIRKHIRHTHAPGEGWQWVPKELTKAMHEAAETDGIGHALLNWIWKQLLAAAPSPEGE